MVSYNNIDCRGMHFCMFFCMNSLQYYLNEVDEKSSAESFKTAFQCHLQSDIKRN